MRGTAIGEEVAMEWGLFSVLIAACRAAGAVAAMRSLFAVLGMSGMFGLFLAFCCAGLGQVGAPPELLLQGDGIEIAPAIARAIIEIVLGFLLAAPIALLSDLFVVCGRILDSMRGTQLAEQLLPTLEHRGGSFEGLSLFVAPLVLMTADVIPLLFAPLQLGYHMSAGVTAELLASKPVDLRRGQIVTVEGILAFSGEVVGTAVALTAPFLIVALLFDGLTGMIGRFAPKLSIGAELAGLRLIGGLLLLFLFLSRGELRDHPDAVDVLFRRANAVERSVIKRGEAAGSPVVFGTHLRAARPAGTQADVEREDE